MATARRIAQHMASPEPVNAAVMPLTPAVDPTATGCSSAFTLPTRCWPTRCRPGTSDGLVTGDGPSTTMPTAHGWPTYWHTHAKTFTWGRDSFDVHARARLRWPIHVHAA